MQRKGFVTLLYRTQQSQVRLAVSLRQALQNMPSSSSHHEIDSCRYCFRLLLEQHLCWGRRFSYAPN